MLYIFTHTEREKERKKESEKGRKRKKKKEGRREGRNHFDIPVVLKDRNTHFSCW